MSTVQDNSSIYRRIQNDRFHPRDFTLVKSQSTCLIETSVYSTFVFKTLDYVWYITTRTILDVKNQANYCKVGKNVDVQYREILDNTVYALDLFTDRRPIVAYGTFYSIVAYKK